LTGFITIFGKNIALNITIADYKSVSDYLPCDVLKYILVSIGVDETMCPDYNKSKNVKKVLNVGGNNKRIPIPSCFDGWQHELLDIDPTENPDILCDARELWKMPPRQYDAIYCSHNLEHYFAHEVPIVLSGFKLLLKKDGFVYIKVPDLIGLMRMVLDDNLGLDSEVYLSSKGPITALDIIYGHRGQIETSGVDFYAHKTGFSVPLLQEILKSSGFSFGYTISEKLEIQTFAFKMQPSEELMELLGIEKWRMKKE
jgi:hypothetical protein